MAGETPAGGTVQTGRGEGIEAQLGSAAVDIVGNLLQGLKVGDVGQLVASLLQQSLVYDDAECLIAVTDGNGLARFVLQVKGVGGHFLHDVGVGQVVAVLAPGPYCAGVAYLEHGGSSVLIHLGGQHLVISTGSRSQNGYGNTGLIGVQLRQILPSLVSLGLEVEIINRTGLGVGGGCGLVAAGGKQSNRHNNSQQNC